MRPETIAEAMLAYRDRGYPLFVAVNEFLDEFYSDPSVQSRAARLADEPVLTGDRRADAYAAAIAEHLHRRWLLGDYPEWTTEACRFLDDHPWFIGEPGPKLARFLLMESPIAFRTRNIYTDREPLTRPRMLGNKPGTQYPRTLARAEGILVDS